MAYNFQGKRALVTGAGGDIGSVIAAKLVECGAHVLALDFNQNALDLLKTNLPSVETLQVDLGDWAATKAVAEKCLPVDLLVNCAAIFAFPEPGYIDEDTLNKVMAVNVNAVINLCQVVALDMKSRECGGAIVNISSQASKFTYNKNTLYSVSKAAVDMVTKGFALEFGPYKIRTNSVNPTLVNTAVIQKLKEEWPEPVNTMLKRIPLGKMAEKYEVADAVLYLLSDRASMINGTNLDVDGGCSTNML